MGEGSPPPQDQTPSVEGGVWTPQELAALIGGGRGGAFRCTPPPQSDPRPLQVQIEGSTFARSGPSPRVKPLPSPTTIIMPAWLRAFDTRLPACQCLYPANSCNSALSRPCLPCLGPALPCSAWALPAVLCPALPAACLPCRALPCLACCPALPAALPASCLAYSSKTQPCGACALRLATAALRYVPLAHRGLNTHGRISHGSFTRGQEHARSHHEKVASREGSFTPLRAARQTCAHALA